MLIYPTVRTARVYSELCVCQGLTIYKQLPDNHPVTVQLHIIQTQGTEHTTVVTGRMIVREVFIDCEALTNKELTVDACCSDSRVTSHCSVFYSPASFGFGALMLRSKPVERLACAACVVCRAMSAGAVPPQKA